MYLKQLYIEGFRNFKKATINFDKHCLLIGANDVGKTNMIYALRILLDRGFSDYDYELKESDFFAYSDTNKIIIRAYLSDVVEDCVVAQMKGKISDDDQLVLQYEATIDNGKVSYNFYCGKNDSEEDLAKIDAPYYRKFLNIKYISSKRDFLGYINKTKKDLLLQSKSSRSQEVTKQDDALYSEIEGIFNDIDKKIPQLSYIKNATKNLNDELNKLSIHNNEQSIVFDTASADLDKVIANVSLSSKFGEKKLFIGGEGRINQIYLSLWALQNQPTDISNEVSIICVEEPEAYLHPHQQRELASYLGKKLRGQVVLTSHSPYIVSEFSPNSIIRLYKDKEHITCVASNGCSKVIGESFEDFGYRMSVIPAEAFFSDCVVLVEGPSEMIFYKTLAKQIGIELDRLNISLLSVDGVGFKTYINILNNLEINWIARTDNDIMKIPHKTPVVYRYGGVERGLSFLDLRRDIISDEDRNIINENKTKLRGFNDKYNIPEINRQAAQKIITILGKYSIFLAKEGLEEDICKSAINSNLVSYYSKYLLDKKISEDSACIEGETIIDDETIIEMMKEKKAVHMYEFLKTNKECLSILKDDALSLPLISAKNYVENTYGAY